MEKYILSQMTDKNFTKAVTAIYIKQYIIMTNIQNI